MKASNIGLKILGILGVILGLFMVFAGIMFLSISTILTGELQQYLLLLPISLPVGIALATIGAVYLFLGICFIILSYFLFKERPFAYWITLILSGLATLLSLISLNLLGLLIYGFVFIYLIAIRGNFMSHSHSDVKWSG